MLFKDKRVIVTGGAGFIGSELVRQLVAEGSHVIVIDNVANGKPENLEGILGEQAQLVVADLLGSERVEGLMKDIDVVFHLACLGVRHSIHSPYENHQVNATATLKLLISARKKDVKRFVYISSSEVYGTALWVPMTEEHPAFPCTVYGASKLAGECYARAFHRTYGYPTVMVRPFNAYGPGCHHEGDSGEVIPKLMLRCMAGKPMLIFGDGKQTRDFTYVGDIARGMIAAACSDQAIGQTINVASGEETSINKLAEEIISVVGKKDAVVHHDVNRPGDVLRLYADNTKAERILGFKPKVKLHEGLTKLRDWYLGLKNPPEILLTQEKAHNWEKT